MTADTERDVAKAKQHYEDTVQKLDGLKKKTKKRSKKHRRSKNKKVRKHHKKHHKKHQKKQKSPSESPVSVSSSSEMSLLRMRNMRLSDIRIRTELNEE